MFHRGRQPFSRRMGNPDIPPMLQRANQLMASGEYREARDAYQKLAQGAESRFPGRAPFLYMQAGHAAILSGQSQAGAAHFTHGLNLLAAQGRFHRMRVFGQAAIEALRAHHLEPEAEAIAKMLQGHLPSERAEHPAAPASRPILPTHCPSCGGAVRPDEIEWLDEITAECAYCGSPLRGDS